MMRFTLANLPPAETSIERLCRLREGVNTLRSSCVDVSDEIVDSLTDTLTLIENQIIAAAPTCSRDIAAKFRFAASLIADDAGGTLKAESQAVFAAITDLASLRGKQWAPIQEVIGAPSVYAVFLAKETAA